MPYMTLYRKFRPDNFADVKGQDHIVTTLRNQILNNRIGHAYLFTGTRGTGKTTMAKIFARAVNCEHPTENGACGECPTCKAIASGSSLNVIEIDAASNNGVDNVRDIVEEVAYRPTEGRYKVYIIDEVHMLSTGAFNALLKTLEEPPEYVIFILATTEVNKLLPTVLSRCQRYDFKRIGVETIMARIEELLAKEHLEADEKAVHYIAKAADGSMRDALSLLEQCLSFHMGERLTYDMALEALGAVDTEVFSRLFRCIRARDVRGCISLLDDLVMQGRELGQFIVDFTWYLRNVMLIQTSDDLEDIIDISTENMVRLKEDAGAAEPEQIFRYIRVFSELTSQIRYASQRRVLIEVALIRLCRPETEKKDDALYDRIVALEDRLASGILIADGAGLPSGAGQGGGSVAGARPQRTEPELPKAIPEDIRQLMAGWKEICGGSGRDQARAVLKTAKPSLNGEGILELVFDEGDMNHHYACSEGCQQMIRELFEEYLGKSVDFVVRESASHQDFENGTVDLSKLIPFDITISEEE